MLPVSSVFDANHPKYLCCCTNCHVTTGTRIIAILETIGLVGNLINSFVTLSNSYENTAIPVMNIASSVITATVISLLWYGLSHEKPGYLLPHLVFQVIAMVVLFIMVILVIVIMTAGGAAIDSIIGVDPSNYNTDALKKYIRIMGSIIIVLCIVSAGLQICFFKVILQAYRFFKDKIFYEQMAALQNKGPYIQQGYTNPPMGYPNPPMGYPNPSIGYETQPPPYNRQEPVY